MELTFSGSPGEDVTVFLQRIHKDALFRGNQRDEIWMADSAAASLRGPALRWYSGLDEDVQGSWPALRSAMLDHWSHDTTQAPNPLTTASMNYFHQRMVRSAPHLSTLTASNFAVAAWNVSEAPYKLRLYKPVRDGIQEYCEGETRGGVLTWVVGAALKCPEEVSDTAPIAADSSYGRDGDRGRMMVYLVSRGNRLRACQHKGSWAFTAMDIPIEGVCTGLSAMWRKDDDGQSIWTVCYSTEHTVHLRQEVYKSNGEKAPDVHKTFPLSPSTFNSPAAVLKHRLELSGGGVVSPITVQALLHTPALGKHRITGTFLESSGKGIQVYVVENGSIAQYEYKEREKDFAGPSLLVPEGYVSIESAISLVTIRTVRRKIFVFFQYCGNNIGYCLYDEGSETGPSGWQQGIFAVQT